MSGFGMSTVLFVPCKSISCVYTLIGPSLIVTEQCISLSLQSIYQFPGTDFLPAPLSCPKLRCQGQSLFGCSKENRLYYLVELGYPQVQVGALFFLQSWKLSITAYSKGNWKQFTFPLLLLKQTNWHFSSVEKFTGPIKKPEYSFYIIKL